MTTTMTRNPAAALSLTTRSPSPVDGPPEGAERLLAWHYTTMDKFILIQKSGEILPAALYVEEGERSIVWFSLNQEYEPTANKAWGSIDSFRTLTRWETFAAGGGQVRIGVDPGALIPWSGLADAAGMRRGVRTALAATGIQQGAVPSRWMGSLTPVPSRDWAAVEKWCPGATLQAGRWAPFDLHAAAAQCTPAPGA